MLRTQDMAICDRNSKLVKAKRTRDTVHACLQQQLQAGGNMESILHTQVSLQKAVSAYEKAVRSSLELVGTGTGRECLVLPQDLSVS